MPTILVFGEAKARGREAWGLGCIAGAVWAPVQPGNYRETLPSKNNQQQNKNPADVHTTFTFPSLTGHMALSKILLTLRRSSSAWLWFPLKLRNNASIIKFKQVSMKEYPGLPCLYQYKQIRKRWPCFCFMLPKEINSYPTAWLVILV